MPEIDQTDDVNAGEPIAIIGMACRYPGGVRSPHDLWQLVVNGQCVVSDMPRDRGWKFDRLFHPDRTLPGASSTRFGSFVHDGGDFDPEFFGISELEAKSMHPVQRLALLTAWEAIERAGIVPASLRGQDVGVFVGFAGAQDYGPRWHETPAEVKGRVVIGTVPSVMSGRLSYFFGFNGPAITVDTACSASLVGVDLACSSLRSGESVLALAGGATFHAAPGVFTEFSRQGALSPDGTCKAFADAADGTGWGEGAGMLLLARLSDAVKRGYPILALIRGAAVNQDGASSTLTAPSGAAQQRVIRSALANAGLGASDVDVVEAHGTGTKKGDPIEAGALLATYGQRPAEHPLWLGSLKSNIGHTLAAAGVGGVIKMVMAMRHRVLPKTLHVDKPNTRLDWSTGAVALLTEQLPWPSRGRPRRAAVSAFGISGTNAHLILEEAPPAPNRLDGLDGTDGPAKPVVVDQPVPWALSARTGQALRDQARRLAEHVAAHPELRVTDVGYSLATGRARFEHRAVVLGEKLEDFRCGLDALAAGSESDSVVTGVTGVTGGASRADGVAFVFPGQGSQWVGMGAELAATSTVYARHLQDCADALAPYCDWSLFDVLRQAEGVPGLDRVDVVQPALFAVMVALARLWEAHGVRPTAVVGHSQGEIAAACVAGALSLQDAAKVVALRSRALVSLSGECGMASVAMAADEAERYLEARQGGQGAMSIAVVNGPRATVLGGPLAELREVVASLAAVGVRARMLPVDYASHTPQVSSTEAEILAQLADIRPRPARVPFYSTVSGAAIDTAELTAEYWYRNLRQTVRFDTAVRAMLDAGHRVFVEASPHPALLQWLEQTAEDAEVDDVVAVGSLRRDDGGMDRFVRSLAAAHVHGVEFDGQQAFAQWNPPPARPRRVELPTYPFQNRRLWLDESALPDTASTTGGFGLDSTGHPWLTGSVALPDTGGRLLTGCLSLRTSPWLADHAIQGHAVVPGAAIVEMAIRAADEAGCASVSELTLHRPMVVAPDGTLRLQVSVGAPGADGRRAVSVFSRPDDPSADALWIRHADGLLAVDEGAIGQPDLTAWPPADSRSVDMAGVYARFGETGVGYGPAFQAVTAAWQRDDALYAEVSVPAPLRDESTRFGLHPVLFDAALHAIGSALLGDRGGANQVPLLPFAWAGVCLHGTGATELRVWLAPADDGAHGAYRVFATDPAGNPVLSVESLALLPAAELRLPSNDGLLESLYVPVWRPVAATRGTTETWAVLDDPGVAAAVAATSYAGMDSLRSALRSGATVPDVVVRPVEAGEEGNHGPLRRALAALQAWLNDELAADSHLVLLTRRAVAARPKEAADPEQAAVWGLVRSAQSENPGRFTLVDIDDAPESLRAVRAAVAGGEPQLAIRAGAATAPRLARETAGPGAADTAGIAAEGTVLITGGTGTLGGALARHLVLNHGVRRLLLAGRRGLQAPGAAELAAELAGLGASVDVIGADVSRREEVAALLAGIPAEHPLTAVVHAAGVLADGLVETLTAEQVTTVMAAKADAAQHLDELTRDCQLAAFVVFSSCAATFGSVGQGNYAAANAFVEALAQRRRALGLPATALAWGLWEQRSELTANVDTAALDLLAPGASIAPLPAAEGLALFDATWLSDDVVSVPVKLTPVGPGEPVASVLRELMPSTPRRSISLADSPANRPTRADEHRDLVRSLRDRSEAERRSVLVELVRTHAAAVLGQEAAAQLTPKRSFRDVGLESLSAVDLRNRLSSAIGKRLTATVVFDHPTPAKLATHIAGLILPPGGTDAASAPAAATSPAPDQDAVADDEIDAMDLEGLLELAAGDSEDAPAEADHGGEAR
jgi:acyl transferase domain-containing protein